MKTLTLATVATMLSAANIDQAAYLLAHRAGAIEKKVAATQDVVDTVGEMLDIYVENDIGLEHTPGTLLQMREEVADSKARLEALLDDAAEAASRAQQGKKPSPAAAQAFRTSALSLRVLVAGLIQDGNELNAKVIKHAAKLGQTTVDSAKLLTLAIDELRVLSDALVSNAEKL